VGHYKSECEEELHQKTTKKGSYMLILDEDSSIGSGQSDKDYDYDDEAEAAKTENHEYNDEAKLQDVGDKGQVLDKQADDDEETESDKDEEEEAFPGNSRMKTTKV